MTRQIGHPIIEPRRSALRRIHDAAVLEGLHQSQASLASQAADVAPIAEALGYYDLADTLRRMA